MIKNELFIGKVWGKVRPMIEISVGEHTYHVGLSHSFRENMVALQKEDFTEGDFVVVGQVFAGLTHRSSLVIRKPSLGKISKQACLKILRAHPKLKDKIDRR